jgi:hypothetical protein
MSLTVVCRFEDCPTQSNVKYPMHVTDETFTHVVYVCPTCQRTRIVTKQVVGGTIGQGRDETRQTGHVRGSGWEAP